MYVNNTLHIRPGRVNGRVKSKASLVHPEVGAPPVHYLSLEVDLHLEDEAKKNKKKTKNITLFFASTSIKTFLKKTKQTPYQAGSSDFTVQEPKGGNEEALLIRVHSDLKRHTQHFKIKLTFNKRLWTKNISTVCSLAILQFTIRSH